MLVIPFSGFDSRWTAFHHRSQRFDRSGIETNEITEKVKNERKKKEKKGKKSRKEEKIWRIRVKEEKKAGWKGGGARLIME